MGFASLNPSYRRLLRALCPAAAALLRSPLRSVARRKRALRSGTALPAWSLPCKSPDGEAARACAPAGLATQGAPMTRFVARSVACLAMMLALASSAVTPARAQEPTLTVFAAASMKNALDEVDAAYTKKTGVKVAVSYVASSTLVKQIEQGAPADVFVSADVDWMDYAS